MTARRKLLIATANRHKTEEFAHMLAPGGVEVVDLHSLDSTLQVEENGATFEENAWIKARAAALAAGVPALADDSGLEVDTLGGAPGVHSARYAGEDATDADNRHKIVDELQAADVKDETPPRSARFRCVLALARADGTQAGCWSGQVEGKILCAGRGDGGFGYDRLFIPDGHHRTFAEMTRDEKAALSHRARATALFLAALEADPGMV